MPGKAGAECGRLVAGLREPVCGMSARVLMAAVGGKNPRGRAKRHSLTGGEGGLRLGLFKSIPVV